MTKLLEQAISKVRELSAEKQDQLALLLLSMADDDEDVGELDEETRAAIQEGLEQARRGEFASDEEVAALWKRHGL
jgi:predicted transcriptional regulator